MSEELECDLSDGPIAIAQKYVDTFSRTKFCDFLKTKLEIKEFEDGKGETFLSLMSLNLSSIYSTNPDNIFELCCNKYGRSYKSVVTIDDLANAKPGDRLYYKFHGDLSVPESLVFTDKDYETRMQSDDNFLDIRLRSDLLSKSFIFIGYSFRDPNIQKLFLGLNQMFKGKMPPSFLIPWVYDPQLEKLTESYGIKIIKTMDIFPEVKNEQEAFDLFFVELAKNTYQKKTSQQIEELFQSKVPNSTRVVGKYDVLAIEASCANEECELAIQKFRAICDTSLIPIEYQERISNALINLAFKVQTEKESDLISASLIHLRLTSPQLRLMTLSSVIATANIRKKSEGFCHFRPHIPGLDENYNLLYVAFALNLLQEWGRTITDGFRSRVTNWVDNKMLFEEYPAKMKEEIKRQIKWAWSTGGHTVYEDPIQRQAYLASRGMKLNTMTRTRDDIFESMLNTMPKSFKKPHEN